MPKNRGKASLRWYCIYFCKLNAFDFTNYIFYTKSSIFYSDSIPIVCLSVCFQLRVFNLMVLCLIPVQLRLHLLCPIFYSTYIYIFYSKWSISYYISILIINHTHTKNFSSLIRNISSFNKHDTNKIVLILGSKVKRPFDRNEQSLIELSIIQAVRTKS